jgi:TM2 domain-containing membrane protein YozV
LFILLYITQSNFATIYTEIRNPTPKDTSAKAIKKLANKEAHKAAIMSTIVPGLGQIYNKKYWKTPIIYAALAGMGYLLIRQWDSSQVYHKELQFRFQHNDTVTLANYSQLKGQRPWLAFYSTTELNTQKLLYQKRFDEAIIGIGLVYVLNIIDASIDGHMKTFDVGDNLSLSVKPKMMYCSQSPLGIGAGVSIALRFK